MTSAISPLMSETAVEEAIGRAYLLPSAAEHREERARLELLQRLRDPRSQQLLASLVKPGMRCLEVGAGLGSMSRWLAQQVGPHGSVVSVDREVSALEAPGCEVRCHDIGADPHQSLGLASFDVVFCRHLLEHLFGLAPLVIFQLSELLKPGGILVIEGCGSEGLRAADPWHTSAAGFDQVQDKARAAFGGRVGGGAYTPALMRRCGLGDIWHGATATVHAGGSDVAQMLLQTADAFSRLSASAGKQPDHMLMRQCLNDPTFLFFGPIQHATAGRRLRPSAT